MTKLITATALTALTLFARSETTVADAAEDLAVIAARLSTDTEEVAHYNGVSWTSYALVLRGLRSDVNLFAARSAQFEEMLPALPPAKAVLWRNVVLLLPTLTRQAQAATAHALEHQHATRMLLYSRELSAFSKTAAELETRLRAFRHAN